MFGLILVLLRSIFGFSKVRSGSNGYFRYVDQQWTNNYTSNEPINFDLKIFLCVYFLHFLLFPLGFPPATIPRQCEDAFSVNVCTRRTNFATLDVPSTCVGQTSYKELWTPTYFYFRFQDVLRVFPMG